MIRLFCGYDHREALGFSVFIRSVIDSCKEPVAITPLAWKQRDGSNAFTYARFLVPYYCGFKGYAIWADGSDMLLRADLAELSIPTGAAVGVVKHDYKTQHPRKYIGTEMECANEDYPRKNWSSLIVWDCSYHGHRVLTPDFVTQAEGKYLHRFEWLPEARIHSLHHDWNHLVSEQDHDPFAKLVHWTLGNPQFEHYKNAPFAQEWRAYVPRETRI